MSGISSFAIFNEDKIFDSNVVFISFKFKFKSKFSSLIAAKFKNIIFFLP